MIKQDKGSNTRGKAGSTGYEPRLRLRDTLGKAGPCREKAGAARRPPGLREDRAGEGCRRHTGTSTASTPWGEHAT